MVLLRSNLRQRFGQTRNPTLDQGFLHGAVTQAECQPLGLSNAEGPAWIEADAVPNCRAEQGQIVDVRFGVDVFEPQGKSPTRPLNAKSWQRGEHGSTHHLCLTLV